jgi:hypothetical protein
LRHRHGFEHGFPLIRSLRASARRSTSELFSFVLSLLIVAGPFAFVDQKQFQRDFLGRGPKPHVSADVTDEENSATSERADREFSNELFS